MTPTEEAFYKAGNAGHSRQQIPYDPSLIHRFAERLYSNAFWGHLLITLGFTATGILFSFTAVTPLNIIIPLIALLVGYVLGAEYAFWVKLKAQLVLCQAEIEYNTRALRQSPSSGISIETQILEHPSWKPTAPAPAPKPLAGPTPGMKVYGVKD